VRSFTAFDAVDLYRLRRPIELAAVRLIIEGNRPLTGIEKAVDAFVALPDAVTWDVAADHDIAYHRSVLAAATSPRLLPTERFFLDLIKERGL
jgi:DNA-binding GntR family transcriptional regulator